MRRISYDAAITEALAEEMRRDPTIFHLSTDAPVALLEEFGQLSSVTFADTTGRELLLLRTEGGWINRVTDRERWGPRSRWHETAGGDIDTVAQSDFEWRELDYDPRTRVWHAGALERRLALEERGTTPEIGEFVHWTAPYRFFSTGKLGLSASLAFRDGAGAMRR